MPHIATENGTGLADLTTLVVFECLIGLQQIGQLRNEARDKELQLKEKEQFHDTEVANNKEIEKKISMAERTYFKLKQELQDAERLRDTFNSEVSTLPINFR